MQTVTKFLVVLILFISVYKLHAQDTIRSNNTYKIEILQKLKEKIKSEEREFLKAEVEEINQRLDRGEITSANAETLKKEAAQKRAANIENRIAIVDHKIALLERNPDEDSMFDIDEDDDSFTIRIGKKDFNDGTFYFGRSRNMPRKYDRRTTSDMVFAIGFNNAFIDGQKLDDSPYKLAGSGFIELGWAWKTRVLDNSNAIRIKYGFSFIWNKLDIKDNQYFVKDGDNIMLEEFPTNLKKAKFRTTHIVFPVHFEFGPSKRIDRDSYFRYSTSDQFKIGLGGYAGFNIGTLQKLKYNMDGRDIKDKIKGGYNTTDFVYGLSGYIAFDDVALYVKYDLSPIFKDQTIDQNNISLGLRFDMD